jgi:hypothetical protein
LPFPQWTDRDIAIAGRYSSRFYWFAHRYVINEAARATVHGPRRAALHALKSLLARLGMILFSWKRISPNDA